MIMKKKSNKMSNDSYNKIKERVLQVNNELIKSIMKDDKKEIENNRTQLNNLIAFLLQNK